MRTRRTITGLSLLALGVTLGCGASKDPGTTCLSGDCTNPDGGGDGSPTFDIGGDGIGLDGATFQEIDLTPANATVYIDTATTPPTAAKLTYSAKLNLSGGGTKDVTSEIAMRLEDTSLGTFSGPNFTSVTSIGPAGAVTGKTTVVHGDAEGKTGLAQLTVVQLRKSGDHRDFYFVVPYLQPPSPDHDVLKFGTNIKQVDVAISMDTTGSMGGSISNLKTNLTGTMFPGLAAAIPSVGIAVAYHDDYPTGPYGTPSCPSASVLPGDVPSGIVQVVTTDVPTAQTAANKLETHCGNDGPEAQEPSMYHILTGKELVWNTGSVAAHTPAPGTSGGVDFRPGSLPVVVEITDITWHDPTTPAGAASPYGSDVTSPPTITDVINAFNAANARFIDITNGAYISFEPNLEDQANQVSDATKSDIPPGAFAAGGTDCPTGMSGAARPATGPGGTCRLNFLHNSGAGVSDSVVKAIQAVSVGSTFDVTAVPSNDPTNAPGTDGKPVDATKFIKDLRAMDEGSPKDGCPAHAAKDTNGDGVKDTFIAVVVGTPVCFEIDPQENTTVKPKSSAQFFNAFIDVLGMPGSVKLDRRNVLFLVPPSDIIPK